MPVVFEYSRGASSTGATTSRVGSSSLVEVMIDQLPRLTERGLRDLQMSIACELCFRGDVRENNEEVEAEHRACGKG